MDPSEASVSVSVAGRPETEAAEYAAKASERDALLQVRDLEVEFRTGRGRVRAVRGVSFEVASGDRIGIVGESGSGKSVSLLATMGLLGPSAVTRGSVSLLGREILGERARVLSEIRGRQVGYVFQDPGSSLNPLLTAGYQVAEVLRRHVGLGAGEAKAQSLRVLESVGFPAPARAAASYPHELSGGMRQRVMIAIALACEPPLLIADEPTTALDVTVQANILRVLRDRCDRLGVALVLVTHSFGVVASIAERTLVMYGGRIVEAGPTESILKAPAHPYTRALLRSVPDGRTRQGRFPTIGGEAPNIFELTDKGCAFAPRCPLAVDQCNEVRPPLEDLTGRHAAACWRTDVKAG